MQQALLRRGEQRPRRLVVVVCPDCEAREIASAWKVNGWGRVAYVERPKDPSFDAWGMGDYPRTTHPDFDIDPVWLEESSPMLERTAIQPACTKHNRTYLLSITELLRCVARAEEKAAVIVIEAQRSEASTQ